MKSATNQVKHFNNLYYKYWFLMGDFEYGYDNV